MTSTRFCALALAVGALAVGTSTGSESGGKRIVCSTTQVADFARQIVGDRMSVQSILAPGQDPHLYEVKPKDSAAVAKADLCLDNGWHLEGKDWMRTLAENAYKPIVSCIEGIEPLAVEEGDAEAHDPHGWFSPANAAVYVRNILGAVCEIDSIHAPEYRARADLYLNELRTLHLWVQRQVATIPPTQRVLVTSHDAFNYFCREYGLRPAAPAGWSTGQEAGGGVTPERRKAAVRSIRERGVKAIFVETSVNGELIRQIAADAGASVGGELYSDSMGVRDSAGETYLGMMRENVITIVEGLR